MFIVVFLFAIIIIIILNNQWDWKFFLCTIAHFDCLFLVAGFLILFHDFILLKMKLLNWSVVSCNNKNITQMFGGIFCCFLLFRLPISLVVAFKLNILTCFVTGWNILFAIFICMLIVYPFYVLCKVCEFKSGWYFEIFKYFSIHRLRVLWLLNSFCAIHWLWFYSVNCMFILSFWSNKLFTIEWNGGQF